MNLTVFGCMLGALTATSLLGFFIDKSEVKCAEDKVLKNLNFYTHGLGRMLTPAGRKIWHVRNILIGAAIILALVLAANEPYRG